MPEPVSQYFLKLGERIVNVGREVYSRLAPGSAKANQRILVYGDEWSDYDLRDMLFDGSVYRPSNQGGALKDVLRQLGKPLRSQDEKFYHIPGYFNPVGQIVR